jgi:hypothetical protein
MEDVKDRHIAGTFLRRTGSIHKSLTVKTQAVKREKKLPASIPPARRQTAQRNKPLHQVRKPRKLKSEFVLVTRTFMDEP